MQYDATYFFVITRNIKVQYKNNIGILLEWANKRYNILCNISIYHIIYSIKGLSLKLTPFFRYESDFVWLYRKIY